MEAARQQQGGEPLTGRLRKEVRVGYVDKVLQLK
ncbi:hypothetical protein LCGC14_1767680, partial [marine sediment metagenome]